MPDRIDAYVKDLRRALVKTMDPRQAQIVSEEVSAHLIDRYEGFLALGSDSEIAELEALRTFGSTAEIAAKFQENKPFIFPTIPPLRANIIEVAIYATVALGTVFIERNIQAIVASPFNRATVPVTIAIFFLIYCLPIFCRNLPWIGFLIGYIGFCLFTVSIRTAGSYELTFPYLLIEINLLSWFLGILFRKVLEHFVNRNRRKRLQRL